MCLVKGASCEIAIDDFLVGQNRVAHNEVLIEVDSLRYNNFQRVRQGGTGRRSVITRAGAAVTLDGQTILGRSGLHRGEIPTRLAELPAGLVGQIRYRSACSLRAGARKLARR